MSENQNKDEKKNKKAKDGQSVVTIESVSAVITLFSLLAFLILCTKSLIFGDIGSVISHFLLGAFGFGAYPLFAALVVFSLAAFFGKKLIKNIKLFLCLSAFVACVMFIVHVAVTYSWETEGYLGQVFAAGAELSSATVVGWLGSLVSFALSSLVGKVGTLIIFSLITLGTGYLTYLFFKKGVKTEEQLKEQPLEQPTATESVSPAVSQAYALYTANPAQTYQNEQVSSTPQAENPFQPTGAYASYSVPEVTQRPGVSLPNDHKSNVPRAQQVNPYEDEQARREFLFGGTARENFNRNLIFDRTARVNTRFEEMQSRLNGERPTQTYTQSYETDMNARGAVRSSINSEREVGFERVQEEDWTPVERNPLGSFDRIESPTDTFDTRDYTPERESFLDVREETPTRDTYSLDTKENEGEYRRHEFMDLFSDSNPRLSAREETPDLTQERRESFLDETPMVEEEIPSISRNEETLTDRRIDIFDEDESENASRFDELPRMGARFEEPMPTRTVEPDPVPPVSFPVRESVQLRQPEPEPQPVVKKPKPRLPYKSAPSDYFDYRDVSLSTNLEEIEEAKEVIISTLVDYKIANPQIASTTYGPTVTRYNVSIPRTVSPKKIIQLDQEIAMQLFAKDGVNIYANYEDCVVSIEVPNKNRQFVQLGCMLTGEQYVNAKPTSLVFAMGKDVANRKVYGDFTQMIHLLVAGTSGSGKSVLLNTMIVSLINKYSPAELRMILIDPKQNEFIVYAGLPHLIVKDIITDAKRSVQALNWAIGEMHRRNKMFADKTLAGTRVVNIDEYNAHVDSPEEKLPRILIIIDELADLMLAAKKDVEEKIQALTQMSRSAGIHVVVSTQRPSTDVITGVIKSNLATRIACKVPTDVDSRVILDQTGAQKLLGKGDFLYVMPGESSPVRVQSAFISSDDIQRVVDYIKFNNQPDFDEDVEKYISSSGASDSSVGSGAGGAFGSEEDMTEFVNALRVFIEAGRASATLLVGKMRIGYSKAARIVDQMAELNYISQYDGAKARKVYITREQFEEKYGSWN